MIEKSNSQAQVNMINSLTHKQNQSYVPFLIKCNRFKQQKNHSPPIGSYNIQSCFGRKSSNLQNKISHFILQAQKAKQQMSIFKSTKSRFQKVQNSILGPAFYNLYNQSQQIKSKKFRRIDNKQNFQKNKNKICPSIPDKESRYGYSILNDRHHKKILKTKQQLDKQRQERKIYLSGLIQQKSFIKFQSSYKQNEQRYSNKKKMYQNCLKFLQKDTNSQKNIDISQNIKQIIKKPKYQNLYHTKKAQLINSYKSLGPGQYNIDNRSFNLTQKTQRHQFFGSTQVRFPEKINQQQKGYSLLQMIKQNKRQEMNLSKKCSKQPFIGYNARTLQINMNNPGPGKYNPNDKSLKKSRGNAVFSQQIRFKQNKCFYPDSKIHTQSQNKVNKWTNSRNSRNLKKQKIKSIHKTYQPVSCDQIYGVLSEQVQNKQHKQKYQKIYKDLGKMSQNQDISSWNYQEKQYKNDNIQYLKNQLAFISSPREEQLVKVNKENL